jgi:N-acetylmuramoyl-L-alanine amidase
MRYPGAIWRGTVPNRGASFGPQLGVVLHIMEGTLDGTDAWFHNPQAQASSHFGVGKDGRVYQWVDTSDRAWAQAAGNQSYLSVECEGYHGDLLTDPQVAAVAGIVAWSGIPLVVIDHPGLAGLGWHGMGGYAWGGHFDCPGDPIIGQRAAILKMAGSRGEEKAMFDPAIGPICAVARWPDGGTLLLAPSGAVFATLGAPYLGGANGQGYFVGRVAAHFDTDATQTAVKTPHGGYTIVATSGERYSYDPKTP